MQYDTGKLECVFSSGKRENFYIAKTLLDNAGINYTTKNEVLTDALGVSFLLNTGYYNPIGAMEILVLEKDRDTAAGVLKDVIEQEKGTINTDPRRSEFNFAAATGVIIFIIVLIFLAVFLVKC